MTHLRRKVGTSCFGNCLCSVHDRREQFHPAGCCQTATGRSAVGSHNREAHARLAKSRIHRRAGSARRLLGSGQNQRRQSHSHEHRPERCERIGNVEPERRQSATYDGAGSFGQQPCLRACEARPALGQRIGGEQQILLSLRLEKCVARF